MWRAPQGGHESTRGRDTGASCGCAIHPSGERHGRGHGEPGRATPRPPKSLHRPETMAEGEGSTAGPPGWRGPCPATSRRDLGEREPPGPDLPQGELHAWYATARGLKGPDRRPTLATGATPEPLVAPVRGGW